MDKEREKEPGRDGAFTAVPRNLQFRVGLLLGFTLLIAAAFVLYVLYARGVFEPTQRLTLVADNVEGVSIGMDLSFSGFPIGRVHKIELADDGRARIEIVVPVRESRWLRRSTIFTLERGVVGPAKIRAFTGNLQDEPLPDGAERTVLRGDTSEEIPRMVATLRSVLENAQTITANEGSLQASLGNLRLMTQRMAGPGGALSGLLGSEDEAKKVLASIDRANALIASMSGVARKLDAVIDKTDQRVYGRDGLMDGTQRAVGQVNGILAEVRDSLKRVDRILDDAQQVSGNAKAATTDLRALRAEVDASLRKVSALVEEINRKWPFERNTEIRLP
ncbi:MAG TPA: MlaD family protein [Burkholderiales bacterium]|nr:MlaD family protein [Burkholderiales bacterium]